MKFKREKRVYKGPNKEALITGRDKHVLLLVHARTELMRLQGQWLLLKMATESALEMVNAVLLDLAPPQKVALAAARKLDRLHSTKKKKRRL